MFDHFPVMLPTLVKYVHNSIYNCPTPSHPTNQGTTSLHVSLCVGSNATTKHHLHITWNKRRAVISMTTKHEIPTNMRKRHHQRVKPSTFTSSDTELYAKNRWQIGLTSTNFAHYINSRHTIGEVAITELQTCQSYINDTYVFTFENHNNTFLARNLCNTSFTWFSTPAI